MISKVDRNFPAFSALVPGKACFTPSANPVALTVGILVSLEPFEHVVAIVITVFAGSGGGGNGAYAAAAEENNQCFRINLAFQFDQEVWIACAAGIPVPFDFYCAGNAADPIPFGTRPDIDQFGPGGELPKIECFLWRQFALVGTFQPCSAGLRNGENFCEFAHDGSLLESRGYSIGQST